MNTNCPFISTDEHSGVEGSSETSLDKSTNSHLHIFSINFVGIGRIPSATIMDGADVDGKLLSKASKVMVGGYHMGCDSDCTNDGGRKLSTWQGSCKSGNTHEVS